MTMTDRDVQLMIERCIDEISQLRMQLAAAQPKAEAYDAINQILGLLPRPSLSYSQDIVSRLRKQIEDLNPPVAEPATQE
jgi:hypothetical protein